MRKIMYLHGLESSNVCDKVDFLKERAVVLAPSIDYRKLNIEEELMYMVESFQPDLIIGSSMGGYCGLLLANHYKVDCLVFNPVVVLGMEDTIIDPAKSEDLLEQMEIECEIERVEGLGHRIPFYVFVDIYNKYVK